MKSKTEQIFQGEIKQSLEKLYPGNSWYYKIPDMPVFSGNKARFTPKKPFDLIFGILGWGFAVETKVHKKNTAWPFSSVSEHQIKGLLDANKAGLTPIIMLNWRVGRGKERINKIITIHIESFIELKNTSKRKSMSYKYIEKFPQMEWNKKEKYWDIDIIK
jgi:penicillin-binding protein-related factor A (putative recombinase)